MLCCASGACRLPGRHISAVLLSAFEKTRCALPHRGRGASRPGACGKEGLTTVQFLQAWAPFSVSCKTQLSACPAGETQGCPPWPLQRPLGRWAATALPATTWGEGARAFYGARSWQQYRPWWFLPPHMPWVHAATHVSACRLTCPECPHALSAHAGLLLSKYGCRNQGYWASQVRSPGTCAATAVAAASWKLGTQPAQFCLPAERTDGLSWSWIEALCAEPLAGFAANGIFLRGFLDKWKVRR